MSLEVLYGISQRHLKVEMCGHVNKRQTALRMKQFKERKTIYSLKEQKYL